MDGMRTHRALKGNESPETAPAHSEEEKDL
jgi:hypothetical protein